MIGNCVCWALIFKLIYGGELRSVHMSGKCRTWYLARKDGSVIMFKRTQYFLPWPIREWLYLGQIVTNARPPADDSGSNMILESDEKRK